MLETENLEYGLQVVFSLIVVYVLIVATFC